MNITEKVRGWKVNGWKVKKMTRTKNWTQADIAIRAGLSRTCVTRVLNGKTCSLSTAQAIAEALDVTLDSILLKR